MNIIELAKEAGVWDEIGYPKCIERFAALVRAEYEKPLKLAEEALRMIATHQEEDMQCNNGYGAAYVAKEAIVAIREVLADHIPDATKMVADHSGDANEMVAEPDNEVVWDASAPIVMNPVACTTDGECRIRCKTDGTAEHYAAPVQPVKQEPVATYMGHRLTPENTKEFWGYADNVLPEKTKLYAAPVDAKAIRAEALEEAAKRFEGGDVGNVIAIAIRGMK